MASASFVLNPNTQLGMLTYRIDIGCSAVPDAGHWERAAKEITVTQQQCEEIAATWELYNWSMVRELPLMGVMVHSFRVPHVYV